MTVSRILERKGSSVVSVDLAEPLQGVIDALARNHIGVVVVTGPMKDVAGIISERDVVRALSRDAASALKSTAADVMTREVATCRLDEAESDVMKRMDEKGLRHLPVMAGGKLVGIVSLRDVIRLRLEKIDELMASITRDAEQTKG